MQVFWCLANHDAESDFLVREAQVGEVTQEGRRAPQRLANFCHAEPRGHRARSDGNGAAGGESAPSAEPALVSPYADLASLTLLNSPTS